jgi:hypothetical protein
MLGLRLCYVCEWWIDGYRALVEFCWKRKTEETWEKSPPDSPYSTQTPHKMVRCQNNSSDVKSQRLSLWAISRPYHCLNHALRTADINTHAYIYIYLYIYIYINTFHPQMSLYKYWEILIFILWASRSAHSAIFHLKHGSDEHWWYLMHMLSQDVLRRNSRWFAFMYTSGISHVIHTAYCSTVLRYWSCARWSFSNHRHLFDYMYNLIRGTHI